MKRPRRQKGRSKALPKGEGEEEELLHEDFEGEHHMTAMTFEAYIVEKSVPRATPAASLGGSPVQLREKGKRHSCSTLTFTHSDCKCFLFNPGLCYFLFI